MVNSIFRLAITGIRLSFQRGKAGGLDAVYHFNFTGSEPAKATIVIKDSKLNVTSGHEGRTDLRVTADSRTWIQFINRQIPIWRCLLARKIQIQGPPRLLLALGVCFPSG